LRFTPSNLRRDRDRPARDRPVSLNDALGETSGGDRGETQVFINGHLKDGTQVGIELDARTGSFGPGGTANGSLTLDLYPGKPPKLDRAGGAGTGQFGTGSGSVTVNGTSGGSINATLDDGVTISGSWTCNS
jgi:hypothetical protein